MRKGKIRRLLRKGALCLIFSIAATNCASAATPPDHAPPPPAAISIPQTINAAGGKASSPADSAVSDSAVPADANASATTRAVLKYLTTLSARPDHKLISGQWAGFTTVDTAEIKNIDKMTGQRVGLVGADYCTFGNPAISFGNVNANMIDYWNRGSLVDIDVHYPNPWTGGGSGDMTVGHFADVITPGTAAYKAYMADLAVIADGLQQLQDAGVTVLFRPLMEMDGNWFWWGRQPDFRKLWIQTFDYLTGTKGLHNLLWVYAPGGNAPLAYYPGDRYVDIVGYDTYGYGANGGKAAAYDALLTTGKPFALTEFGLQSSAFITETDPPYNLDKAIRKIRKDMPKAVYFMAWSNAKRAGGNYWGIDAQYNAAAALNNPAVQNAPVPWKPPAPTSSQSPALRP